MIKSIPEPLASKLSNGRKPVPTGEQWLYRCPVHDDSTNSLAVRRKDDGRILIHCHAGCTTEEVVAAVGLTMRDLLPENAPELRPQEGAGEWTPHGPAEAVYDYTDGEGRLLYQVLRIRKPGGGKSFMQRQPNPAQEGRWIWNLKGVRPTLFRLPKVRQAIESGQTVWIVEGEKDVITAERLGLVATTNSGGAGKFPQHAIDLFSDGADVMIVPDADDAGRQHGRRLAALLKRTGATVTVAEPAEGCKDLSEHVAAGLGLDELNVIPEVPPPDLGLLTIRALLDSPDPEFDWIVPGLLERGERMILTASEGGGKMQPLSTRVPTPTGWTTIGDIRVGDRVIDRDGRPTTVTGLTPIEYREAYEVQFNRAAPILACEDHDWVTQTLDEREKERLYAEQDAKRAARVAAGLPAIAPRGKDQRHLRIPTEGIRSTKAIMESLRARPDLPNGTPNHTIRAVRPLDLPEADLPIDPYLLGVHLGDGGTGSAQVALNLEDAPAIIERLIAGGATIGARSRPKHPDGTPKHCETVGIRGLRAQLRAAGIFDGKRIPEIYLRASHAQRLALLQGLMDTDGYAPEPTDTGKRGDPGGRYEIIVTTKHGDLGYQVVELLRTLGIIPSHTEKTPTISGIEYQPVHRITFRTHLPVFTVPRKAERMRPPRTDQASRHSITNVRNTGVMVPMRCLQVDSPSHTYLTGDDMVPTHNCLTVDTPLAGPNGWTTMGAVMPGDVLFDRDGEPTTVLATTAVSHREVLRVHFDDGSYLDASADHLWVTTATDEWERYPYAYRSRRHGEPPPPGEKVRTTAEIAASIGAQHAIALPRPLHVPPPPSGSPHTLDGARASVPAVPLGMEYLSGALMTRDAVLATPTAVRSLLAPASREMTASLGGRAVGARAGSVRADGRRRHRWITAVEETGEVRPMRCITVDSPTSTYLAGEHMTPTHNTTWLRQFAVLAAAGLNPNVPTGTMQLEPIESARVLWVDAENSVVQNRRNFRPLVTMATELGFPPADASITFAHKPQGLDLTSDEDALWLAERIAITSPDILVIGPWYRLITHNPNDEQPTRRAIAVLDDLRSRHRFALLMEAHSPHSQGSPQQGGHTRPHRPIGSSVLLRWPEYGYALAFEYSEDGTPDTRRAQWVPWRGGRDVRRWPDAYVRGTKLPWMAEYGWR